jgi:hypothetical protein
MKQQDTIDLTNLDYLFNQFDFGEHTGDLDKIRVAKKIMRIRNGTYEFDDELENQKLMGDPEFLRAPSPINNYKPEYKTPIRIYEDLRLAPIKLSRSCVAFCFIFSKDILSATERERFFLFVSLGLVFTFFLSSVPPLLGFLLAFFLASSSGTNEAFLDVFGLGSSRLTVFRSMLLDLTRAGAFSLLVWAMEDVEMAFLFNNGFLFISW